MQSKIERYTPSDVGVVPADWATPLLSELSTLITNGFVGTASPYYVDEHEGIPYFFGKNVRANKLDPIGIRYITPEFHEKQSKTALKTGDLLTVQSGHIGETAVVTEEYDNTNCHALIVTRLKQDLISPIFLSYYINSEIGKARLKGLEVGSTILHINTKDLKKFRIIQPSLPEQQKIAKILTTWDKAIDTTERLIDNSKQQKKALMQQLLTGKKRLLDESGKRFEGEWDWLRASEIFKPISKKNNSANEELLSVTQDRGVLPRSILERRVVMPDGSTKGYKLVEKGNFIISLRSFQGGLEYSYFRGLVSPAYTVLEPIVEINDEFYKHYYKSYDFIGHLAVAVIGIRDGKQISYTDFSFLRLPYPPLKEQQKIAAVLTNADKEINLLEQQLTDLQQEKKALMQVLLTGKKRVKLND